MGSLFLFLLLQIVVDSVCQFLIPTDNIAGLLAYYLSTSLIISFVWSLLQVPKNYRKEFLKQPIFHKNMLTFFLIFFAIDMFFFFI